MRFGLSASAASLAAMALSLWGVPQAAAQYSSIRPQQSPGSQSATSPSAAEPQLAREQLETHANLCMVRKQYSEAAALYQQILRMEPRNAVVLNKLGIAYHQQSLLNQAKRCYERSFKADKHYASAQNNLGALEYERRRYRQAVKHYRKALELAPEMATAHRNLGTAYLAQKKYDEALSAFHRALELDPQVFERRAGFGTVLQHISVDDKSMFYFFLAKSYATLGNAERCAHYLRKARDEGYRNLEAVKTDPAFAGVIKDPSVLEVLQEDSPYITKPAATPPGL